MQKHNFSLSKYYELCDEIHEVVKEHDGLLQMNRRRFENGREDASGVDKELHAGYEVSACCFGD